MARNNRYQEQYQKNREEFNSRRNQPDRHRQGNYRLDEGRFNRPMPSSAIDDRDYFEQGSRDNPKYRRNRVYYMDEYSQRRDDLSYRINQPQARSGQQSNQRPSQPSDAYIRKNRNQYINPTRRTYTSIHRSNHGNSRIHRMIQAKRGNLPKGKTELAVAFMIIYVIIFIASYNLSPIHRVNHIKVKGNNLVPSEVVAQSSRIYNFDTYNRVMNQRNDIIQLILEEIPMVESVEFTRPSWQSLEINVKEHDFVGFVKESYQVYPVLSNGEILQLAPSSLQIDLVINSLPELIGFTSSGQRLEIAKGLRQIDDQLLDRMLRIYNTSQPDKPNAIEVHMDDGNIIKAITSTFAQKVKYYDQLLQQIGDKTGLINLEVGAYFDSDTSSATSIKLNNN